VAGGSRRFRLDIPPAVAEVIRHLSPDLKRGVRSALRALSVDPQQGVRLFRELERQWRYRVRRYRIVYDIDSKARRLRVLAVDQRFSLEDQLQALADAGETTRPGVPKGDCTWKVRGLGLPPGTAARLLDEVRDDRI
jgi:mRNA-degrading endonuclease RelE of RelBE toxin-antitoxin system